jgi:hypothetical protein
MILLITPSVRAHECAEALQKLVEEPVQVALNLQQAGGQLRSQEFSAVVIDQSLVEAEPDESDTILQHLGTAIPVYVNFAISGVERVSRELRAALARRRREVLVARSSAEQTLRSELKGPVTALLLSCEMALKEKLPSAAESKIRMVYDLAREVRTKLGVSN